MITIKNLTKSYKDNLVLKDINIHVNKGDIYGFLGRNGAGKTTMLNIITNLIPKDSGNIIIDPNHKIGYLPESPEFYDYMSGQEYLDFLGKLQSFSKEKYQKKSKELLKLVGLNVHPKQRIKNYSRGMKQRLGIASVLMHDPDLLLLDEPSSALDPQGRKDILELLLTLNEMGKTILFSTHILTDVEKVCNKVGILHNGEIVIETNVQDLMNIEMSYRMKVTNPKKFAEYAESKPDIHVIDIEENSIVIRVEKDIDLFKSLSDSKERIYTLEMVQTTLEDIFVKVVK